MGISFYLGLVEVLACFSVPMFPRGLLHVCRDEVVENSANDQDPKQPSEPAASHHKGALVLKRIATIGQRHELEPLDTALERAAQVLERHPLVGEADEPDRLVAEYPGPGTVRPLRWRLESGDARPGRRASVLASALASAPGAPDAQAT